MRVSVLSFAHEGLSGRREANTMYIERLERPADGFGYEQYNSRPRLRQRFR